MNRLSKTGVVLGGYAGALLVTWAVFYIYVFMRKDIGPASGGMQAFGDSLLFAGMFGLLALIPTALALYDSVSIQKILDSVFNRLVGGRGDRASRGGPDGEGSSVPFGRCACWLFRASKSSKQAPLFGLAFVVCAVIAPTGRSRLRLVAAAGIEFAVAAYAFFCSCSRPLA